MKNQIKKLMQRFQNKKIASLKYLNNVLMYFSQEYFEIYVVDLNQGSYEIIRSADRYNDSAKKVTGDFAQLMHKAIVSWSKPPYRERFNQLTNLEQIKRRFAAGEKKIEFIYKSYDEKWKRLECFPIPEYAADNEEMILRSGITMWRCR